MTIYIEVIIINNNDINKLSDLFQLLAEKNRLKIIFALEDKALSVSEITKITALSQPLVSFHLKALNEAGLIEKYRESSFVFNKLSDKNLLFLIKSFVNFTDQKSRAEENSSDFNFPFPPSFPPWK
jgi:DNA-binding transcriptional ArsR family regulator